MKPSVRSLGKGRESVWDYPRPPLLEPTARRIEVFHSGIPIARSISAQRVLETSHPPVYYIPFADIDFEFLERSAATSYCEFKGQAAYFDLSVLAGRIEKVAWCYPAPVIEFALLEGHLAFYPSRVEECRVDGELVRAQDGDFYGGWITNDIVGPFKGGPGTLRW